MPAGSRTRRRQQVRHRLAGVAGEGNVCADRLDGAIRQVQGFFERGRTLPPMAFSPPPPMMRGARKQVILSTRRASTKAPASVLPPSTSRLAMPSAKS